MTVSTKREADILSLEPPTVRTSTPPALDTNGNNLPHRPRATGALRPSEAQKTLSDTTSDKATAAFVRRVLCSHNVLLGNGEKGRSTPRPIEEVLPPLTSSNEVDLQLYGIISVIIKEFVQTWYSKITPDHVFVNEVLQIIAHCTRGLEQRLRGVDLEALLLDEIPELLENHLSSFRLAKEQAASPHSLVSDHRLIYHALHPHPALSPVPTDSVPSTIFEQRENESAWRQLLVQGALAVLLPTEDMQNGCLRALVAEIFAEMILGNGISGKACEGWLLWEAITNIAKILQTNDAKKSSHPAGNLSPEQSITRLERFGLLSSTTDQHAGLPEGRNKLHQKSTFKQVSDLFWAVVQYVFLICTVLRAAVLYSIGSTPLPSRAIAGEESPAHGAQKSRVSQANISFSKSRQSEAKRPIVSMRLWGCIARLVELDMHMPWLSGSVSLLHFGLLAGPGKVGDTDGILDRFLSHTIRMRILNPTFLPVVLRTLRATLFPNNALGPQRQLPSDEEVREIKRRCAVSLREIVPPQVAATYLASQDAEVQLDYIEEVLGCLDDSYLNKHLIFQIIELIVLRLIPELGERDICDLMAERLG